MCAGAERARDEVNFVLPIAIFRADPPAIDPAYARS
jgi:hypothetical protein